METKTHRDALDEELHLAGVRDGIDRPEVDHEGHLKRPASGREPAGIDAVSEAQHWTKRGTLADRVACFPAVQHASLKTRGGKVDEQWCFRKEGWYVESWVFHRRLRREGAHDRRDGEARQPGGDDRVAEHVALADPERGLQTPAIRYESAETNNQTKLQGLKRTRERIAVSFTLYVFQWNGSGSGELFATTISFRRIAAAPQGKARS